MRKNTNRNLVVAFFVMATLLAGMIYFTGDKAARMAARAHNFLFPKYKVETAIAVVAPDSTLWEVSCEYLDKQDKYRDVREFMEEIVHANNLPPGHIKPIQPGQKLIVPLCKAVK